MLSLALCLVALSPLAQDRRPVELPPPSTPRITEGGWELLPGPLAAAPVAACGGLAAGRWDPTRYAGAVLAHAEELFARILEQDGARLPSDRRYHARETTPREGIEIPVSLYRSIVELRP